VGRGGVILSAAQRRQGGAGPGDGQTLLGGAGPTAGEEHGRAGRWARAAGWGGADG
jgi:hypothetical protein